MTWPTIAQIADTPNSWHLPTTTGALSYHADLHDCRVEVKGERGKGKN